MAAVMVTGLRRICVENGEKLGEKIS